MALAPGEALLLHIYLDRSVLEVFANERACVTARCYPTNPDSLSLALAASGGSATLAEIDVWEMASIWGDTESPTST